MNKEDRLLKYLIRIAWATSFILLAAAAALLFLRPGIPAASSSGTFNTGEPVPTAPAVPTITPGPAPTSALRTLDGNEVTLSTWRGKRVILNFWASWCYPCRTEMPALAAVHSEDIVVVGVNYEEDADTAREFVEELDLRFPILLDPEGDLADQLDVVGLPSTFFINEEGQIAGSHIGPLTEEMLQQILNGL